MSNCHLRNKHPVAARFLSGSVHTPMVRRSGRSDRANYVRHLGDASPTHEFYDRDLAEVRAATIRGQTTWPAATSRWRPAPKVIGARALGAAR